MAINILLCFSKGTCQNPTDGPSIEKNVSFSMHFFSLLFFKPAHKLNVLPFLYTD